MTEDIKTNQKYNPETHLEEIECEVSKATFDKNFEKAIKLVAQNASAPGFRKGKVPKAVLLRNSFEAISDKAINLCIDDCVKSLSELKPRPLEPLNVTSLKQTEGENLSFTLSYLPTPSVEITDISKIAIKKVEPKQTDDAEVEKELANIWYYYSHKKNNETKREDFSIEKVDSDFFTTTDIATDYPGIKSAEELKDMLRTYINQTYERDAAMSWERLVQDEIIKSAKYTKAEGLIDKELNKRLENYKAKFTQIGMNADEYMEKNKLSGDELKKEWAPAAERDVKLEIFLQTYGQEKKIEPTSEDIKANMQQLDPQTRNAYGNDENTLRSLIRYYFINQKAYEDIITIVRKNSGLDKEDATIETEKPQKKKVSKKK